MKNSKVSNNIPFITSADNIKYKDVLVISLLLDDDFTLLPEILDCVGEKNFFRFIDVFAGATVSIPPRENFVQKIRDTEIFIELKNCKSDDEISHKIDLLSDRYEIHKKSVKSIYTKIKKRMDSYNESFAVWSER